MRKPRSQKRSVLETAIGLVEATGSQKLFVFLNSARECAWFLESAFGSPEKTVIVVPKELDFPDSRFGRFGGGFIRIWHGNQSRYSRIKYAFLHGVLRGLIDTESKVICVLGPWGREHLDTITIHDLAHSWSQDFPFDPRSIIENRAFRTIMAVVDVALDIGALGREGKSVGTAFIVGDTGNVMKLSHQAVYNPFRGYPKKERLINRSEVVESIKELSKLDGAFVISEDGVVEAAGRHLDARSVVSSRLKGYGSRHRSAAGITKSTQAVAVVVSESTGRVTIFDRGRVASTLEPVISRRLA